MEIDNRLLFPLFEPEVAGYQAIMFIYLAVAVLPAVILARRNAQPLDKSRHSDTALLSPVVNNVDHGIANIMGDPGRGQRSPRSFFDFTCSSMSSESTSFLFLELGDVVY